MLRNACCVACRKARVMMRPAVLSVVAILSISAAARTFVHPGIDVSQADIDRARKFVSEGREPWAGAFVALKASGYSNPDIDVSDRGTTLSTLQCNGTIGRDGRRAHDLALLYRLTDDERYATKAIEFLNANSHYADLNASGTGPLDFGKIYLLVEAAELVRSHPGWAKADKVRFAKMLRDVFWPQLKNGDPRRYGNQGLFAYRGALAIAIFLDDEKKYDRVWRYLNGMPHREDDEPFVSGPPITDLKVDVTEFQRERRLKGREQQVADYGYDEQLRYYIYANGQCQESSRDQTHAMVGLFQYVAIAEAFWLQGDDLYSACGNRILRGLEWNLRYNFGDGEPEGYTDVESEATFANRKFYRAKHRSGRWDSLKPNPWPGPNFGGPGAPRECAYAHYKYDVKVPEKHLVWLKKAIERENAKNGGCEIWGAAPNWFYEWSGWGTLMKRRDQIAK